MTDILGRIAQGEPFEEIFAVRKKGTVWQLPDGKATFAVMGTDGARFYIWDCQHATVERTLPGKTRDDDAQVLGSIVYHVHETMGCQCEPEGWSRA